ncbi:MAG TPA: AsmA family protein [Candidatus Angelobacter sp.]|nr:AsmA family protein [Candidatus Angelobacter sp.]
MAPRKKSMLVLVVIILLAVFIPPNINGTRFKKGLAGSLSAALGRDVKIGQVKYRIFPRPGFDIYDLQVMDDPAFSNEPVIMCGKVTADLRLTSLWQGRLEIANLKLTDDAAPPSLNLVYSRGHWNLESLLVRVEQVPTAPTAKRRAEQRARFPYIEASSGRINLKIGPEKKPYALTNTDFGFWLASENQWHVRLEGHPVRTDMNLSDTGTVKLEGDLRRSSKLEDMPVKLDLNWEKAQLGQFSSLLLGHDPGWRGAINGNVQLSGTPANLHLVSSVDIREFRRFDINRNGTPQVHTRCLGEYAHEELNMRCDTPLDSGGVIMTARWAAANPRDYDVSAVATHVPLSVLATFARHSRRTLPDDVTATGDLNAAFGFHSRNGVRNWHGTGMTSPFLLQSSVAEKPFPVSSVRFHIGPAETPVAPARRKGTKSQDSPSTQPDTLTLETFSVQLGPSTTLEVQGTADGKGYWLGAKGMVPLERLLALGKTTGFQSDVSNTTASAIVNLNISGPWANFAPPRVSGTAHVQNAASWIGGIKDRLIISEADAQLNDVEVVLTNLKASFEHTPVSFAGTVSKPWSCTPGPPCPFEFDLHSDSVALADLASLLGANSQGWNLPFFSDSSNKLPDFRANGTFSAAKFTLADLPLEGFKAHVELGDKALLVGRIAARLAGGSADGDWHADWSTGTPAYAFSGSLSNVAMEKLDQSAPQIGLVTSWISGRADLKYSVKFDGNVPRDMLSSATGRLEYVVNNGTSRALLLDGGKPLKFQSSQGAVDLEKQTLRLLPGKIRAENRIYEVSGTVSLADKKTKLTLSTSGGSRWEVTGALDKPQISEQQATAEATAARPR